MAAGQALAGAGDSSPWDGPHLPLCPCVPLEVDKLAFHGSPKLAHGFQRPDMTWASSQSLEMSVNFYMNFSAMAGSSSPDQLMLALAYWESEANIIQLSVRALLSLQSCKPLIYR